MISMIVSRVNLDNPNEARTWDECIPENRPDMRTCAIRAVTRNGLLRDPIFAMVRRPADFRAVAAGILQFSQVQGPRLDDADTHHPLHEHIAQMMVIAPAIPSGLCGVAFFSEELDIKRQAFRALLEHFFNGRFDDLQVAWDFQHSECEQWADIALELGFFRVPQGRGFSLPLPTDTEWRTFDDYLQAMRCRYRKHHLDWIRRAQAANISVGTASWRSFVDDIPDAVRLLADVATRQGVYFTIPTAAFLKDFSRLPGAEATVCRDIQTSGVLGVNLLCHSGDTLFNLDVGFRDKDRITYQALLQHSVRRAIELRCRRLHLGQRADHSKLMLGAVPTDVFLYARHPSAEIHRQLQNLDSPAGLPHDRIDPTMLRRRIFRRPLRIALRSQDTS